MHELLICFDSLVKQKNCSQVSTKLENGVLYVVVLMVTSFLLLIFFLDIALYSFLKAAAADSHLSPNIIQILFSFLDPPVVALTTALQSAVFPGHWRKIRNKHINSKAAAATA